ncbi:MAG TPA: chaperone modulator CbpM [Woeseiaceae bacterium]|nr:chaperone modulator CbpM [Woeseiaceae bacterium]
MTRRDVKTTTLVGTILEEEVVLSLAEVCRASRLSAERVIEMAEEGIVEPVGSSPERWRFHGASLRRVRCARRLEEDLGVNTAGIALVLDLLDELEQLRARLGRFEP